MREDDEQGDQTDQTLTVKMRILKSEGLQIEST